MPEPETDSTLSGPALSGKELRILNTTSDGFWILDMGGRFLEVNDAYLAESGYTREELLQLSIGDIDAGEPAEATEARIRRLREEENLRFRVCHRRKDGTLFPVEITASLLRDGGEQYIICFCRNISAQLEAQQEIERLLGEKELLLKEVHHRVKNDLFFVHSMLNLQADLDASGRTRGPLLEARKRISVIIQVYEELYQGSSITEVDSTHLAERIISGFRSEYFGAAASITYDIEPFPVTARIAIALGTILNELIINSMKHAPACPDREHEIEIRIANLKGRQVLIEVRDNGEGFPRHVLSGESDGFGLTVIRALASQYEGAVSLFNDGGARTIVEMAFPA